MSERTVVAESVRLSRAAQHAAELAAAVQEQARDARIERHQRRIGWAIQALFSVMAALWLLGIAVIVFWGVVP